LWRVACLTPTTCSCQGRQAHRRMTCGHCEWQHISSPTVPADPSQAADRQLCSLQTQGNVALPVLGHLQQSLGFHLCDPWFDPLASFQWSRGHPGTLRVPPHLPGRPHPGRPFFYRPPWRAAFPYYFISLAPLRSACLPSVSLRFMSSVLQW
jgi:hypothetical protein